MRFLHGKFLVLLLVFAAVITMGADCIQTGGKKDPIRIGVNNWSENIAVANMWKHLLEEEGYTVELVRGEKAVIWTGVASGDLDLSLEVWLPTTDAPYWAEYKEDLEQYGPWYEGTGLGLVVPAYVEVNSIEELNANKDKFLINGEPSIVGIDAGASLMRLTREAIDAYGLDYQLLSGSGPAMTASLKEAYDKQEPILVTLWNPHWAFAEFDLKYLDDPKDIYGDPENITLIARKGFGDEYPEVVGWLSNWKMDDQSLGGLMATINEKGDAAEGSREWIEEHRQLVNEWVS